MLLLLLCLDARSGYAQIFYNNGAVIHITTSGIVYVSGSATNNSGNIDNDGTWTITNDHTIGTVAEDSGSGLYYIGGDWVNNGTFTRGISLVNFNGASAQYLRGTQVTTFFDVTFSNGGTKTLLKNERVQHVADFLSGIVYTKQDSLLTFNTPAGWSNASNASYVDGPAGKDRDSAVEWTFPIGKVGRFQKAGVLPQSATATTYRAEYFFRKFYNTTSKEDPPLKVISTVHYWYVDKMTPAGANAKVRLYWIPGDYNLPSYISDITALRVARWDSIPPTPPWWKDNGQTSVTGSYISGNILSDWVTTWLTNASTNQPFTIASTSTENALPVELGFFDAEQKWDEIELNWRTYAEINNRGFYVSRRGEDGIGRIVRSFATDTALLAKSIWGADYQTFDRPDASGYYTYDLFQRDDNGITTRVASKDLFYQAGVEHIQALSAQVYPNPARDAASVIVKLPASTELSVRLFDLTGREYPLLFSGIADQGPHTLSIDTRQLASGRYMLRISTPDGELTTPLVVAH